MNPKRSNSTGVSHRFFALTRTIHYFPGRACAFGAKLRGRALRACPHRRTYSSRPPRQYKKGTQPMLCSLFGCPWQTRKERSDGIAHRSPLHKEAARSRHCRRAKRSTKSVRCEAHEKREVPCLGTSLFWLPLADSNCRHCGYFTTSFSHCSPDFVFTMSFRF